MGKGINIEFVSDVRRFLGGTKDVEAALDSVAGSLDDLTKDAARTGEAIGDKVGRGGQEAGDDVAAALAEAAAELRRLERAAREAGSDLETYFGSAADEVEAQMRTLGEGTQTALEGIGDHAKTAGEAIEERISDGAEQAQDAGRDLERKFRDVFDGVHDGARTSGDDLGDNIRRGADRAEEGLDHFKDEANETAREAAASFDGTAESMVDAVQEIAANALGGFGPIGAAAGLALAAGAGLAWQEWQKRTERIKELVTDLYEDMLASGQDFASESFINDQISRIMTDAEDAVVSYTNAQEQATRAGVDLSLVLRAYAGDQDAANQVAQAARDRLAELGDDAGSTALVLGGLIDGVTGVGSAATKAADRVDVGRRAMLTSAEAARDYAAAQAGVNDALTDATTAIEANTQAYADDATQLRTENLGVLQDLAGELDSVNQAAAAAGVTGRDLAAVQRDQATAFMGAARQAGLTATEAYDLARTYGLIPQDVHTEISKRGVDVGDIDAITDAWNRVPLTRQTTYTIAEVIQRVTAKDAPLKRASGGYVDGPGGPLDDAIPARLSRGEYVLDAQTTQRIGIGRLDQLNNGQNPPAGPPQPTGPTRLDKKDLDYLVDRLTQALAASVVVGVNQGIVNERRVSRAAAGSW